MRKSAPYKLVNMLWKFFSFILKNACQNTWGSFGSGIFMMAGGGHYRWGEGPYSTVGVKCIYNHEVEGQACFCVSPFGIVISLSVFGLTCPPGGQVSGNTVLLSFCVSFSAPFKQLLVFFFAELSLYEHFI